MQLYSLTMLFQNCLGFLPKLLHLLVTSVINAYVGGGVTSSIKLREAYRRFFKKPKKT